jgi:hypothetical protein
MPSDRTVPNDPFSRNCLFTIAGRQYLGAHFLAALAETTPRPGSHDNRVRVATWTEGQVYRIVTTLTRVTTVEFGEGETIRSIIAGDTVGFQFDGVPGGRAFAIKPTASGVATNITVYTNRRSYYFHVVEARETPHYVVQFRYPDANVHPRGPSRPMRRTRIMRSARLRNSHLRPSGMTAPSRISASRGTRRSLRSSDMPMAASGR